MEKVEPTPEIPEGVSASSELLAQESATLRRWGRIALRYGAVGVLAGGVAFGIGNRGGVDSTIGGADVTTQLSFNPDSAAIIKSAPLSLRFDHQTGIPFIGAEVAITNLNLPQHATQDAAPSPDANELDMKSIVKSMGVLEDPQAVTNKLVTDYERQAGIWLGSGFLGGLALLASLDLAKVTIGRYKKPLVAGLTAGSLVATGALSYQPTGRDNRMEWSHLGVQVGTTTYTFNYSGVLGKWAATQYMDNVKTYNTIQGNTTQVLGPIAAEDKIHHPDEKKINIFSDWHCNIGMARVIGTIDKTMGVNATINAGDTALGGTSQESTCADILAYNLKKNTGGENYISPGNHDFNFIINELEKDNVTVMNGEIVTIAGVRAMGFEDPTTSPAFIDKIHSRNFPNMNEDQVNALVDKFKQDATEKTCKQNPAILIIHEPQQTTNAAMNCATLTINGHTHVVQLPRQISPDHTVINDGSIGGISSEKQGVVGTLKKEATSYIIYVADGQPVGLRLITIKTNNAVEVSTYMPVPHPITDKPSAATNELPLVRNIPRITTNPLIAAAK